MAQGLELDDLKAPFQAPEVLGFSDRTPSSPYKGYNLLPHTLQTAVHFTLNSAQNFVISH